MTDRLLNFTKTEMALWILLISYLAFLYGPGLFSSVLSSDMAILLSFAERIADGMKPTEGYYDPNPPMSMLIYVPVVWIYRLIDMEIYHVHFFYTVFIIILSFVLSAALLKRINDIDHYTRNILLLSGLAGLFIIPSIHFGDRDHLIICGLLPFTLVQICYLKNIHVPLYLKIPSLFLGTVGVLIKPHYGLLPSAMLVWRFVKTRDLKIVFQSDFLFLALGVISYIGILLVFFSDYLFVVLPDVIRLYAPIRNAVVWPEMAAYSMLLLLCIFAAMESRQGEAKKQIVYTLCFFTFLMLVTFIVQGKGLNYHRIPFLVFFYSGFTLSVFLFLNRFTKQSVSIIFSFLLCMFALLSFRGLPADRITHDTFKNLPISKALEEYCPKNETCRFFFYHDTSEIIHQLGIYHDAFHASRFTSLWFLPVLLVEGNKYDDGKGDQAEYSQEELRGIREKYTAMMVEDFKTMQPDILIILTGEIYDNRSFEFVEYFSSSPEFVDVMKNYKQVDALTFKREIYYPGMTTPFTGRDPDTLLIYKRRKY